MSEEFDDIRHILGYAEPDFLMKVPPEVRRMFTVRYVQMQIQEATEKRERELKVKADVFARRFRSRIRTRSRVRLP